MKRRVIALVAALLLAGVGTLVLVGFVRGASDRAAAGQNRVQAYLVRLDVPIGTKGEDIGQYVELAEVLEDSLAPSAITDLTALNGFVAEVKLLPGDQLTSTRWVTPEELDIVIREFLPQSRVAVPEGMLTLPVSLSAEQALGGLIQPGDTVAIIAHFGQYPTGGDAETVTIGDDVVAIPDAAGEDELTEPATHIILHQALVIEVLATTPPIFAEAGDGVVEQSALLAPSGNFVVTFALSPGDVERVVFTANEGAIWLALQSEDDTGPTSVVTIDDIFKD